MIGRGLKYVNKLLDTYFSMYFHMLILYIVFVSALYFLCFIFSLILLQNYPPSNVN